MSQPGPEAQATILFPAVHNGTARIRFGDASLGGEELAGAVGAVARRVAGARRVAVVASPSLSTLVAVAGIIESGAAAVLLNPAASSGERDHILRDSAPDLVLTDVDLSHRTSLPEAAKADETPALILYTSGATGPPKGVVLSRRAIAFDLDMLTGVWGWHADDVLVHALPLFHVHGLVFGGLGPLRIGSPLHHTGAWLKPTPEGTLYFGVPSIWTSLSDDEIVGMRGARLLVSGAATLPRTVFDRVHGLSGHRILDRYAMTETLVSTSPRHDAPHTPGHVGPPLSGVEVELRAIDDDGADREDMGEVHVRGPNLFSGYLGRPEPWDSDGWFPTGDLGSWNESGGLTLVGRRATDLIKTAGYRVGAGEVEDVLLAHEAVAEVAVAGVPDDVLGQHIVAWVVPAEPVDEKSLLRFAAAALTPYKRPRQIRFVDHLPRNAMGKIQKRLLRD
ncbi:AMP-binding protein [Streptomyces canus]|uniref:AMP-binding protein n=1 Tax=Streptomyces canus TaxID=58343 RepID=UPI0036C3B6E8